MKDLQTLKAEHKAELEKLKAKLKAEMDKAKALTAKKQGRERKGERKAFNRAKFLLAGELVAEMKRTKDVSQLKSLAAKQQRETDKKAIERLIKHITEVVAPLAADKKKQNGLLI